MTFGAFRRDKATTKIAVALILLIGALLRLWQYGANSSLWLDEAALARNIVDRSSLELLAPLDYDQMAPVGFLLAQKVVVTLAGPSEYSLRLIPITCGIASLLLFLALARAVLPTMAAVYALGLFSFGQPFVYFSAQVKQYAVDVAAALVALLIVVRLCSTTTGRQRLAIGLAGVLIPWISQPAMLVLAGAALGLGAHALLTRHAGTIRALWPILVAWATSAAASGLYALRTVSPSTRDYLHSFWREGFMPLSPWAQVRWLWGTSNDVFSAFGPAVFPSNGGLGYVWSQLFVLAAVVGFVQLARTRREVALILLGPIVLALAGSLLRLYPLSGRLLLFLVPVLLLAAAAGAHAVVGWSVRQARVAGAALALVFVGIPVHAAVKTRPPFMIQPLRPVLEEVVRRRNPGERIYVDHAAAQAFMYYASRFRFEPSEFIIGKCAPTDRRDYLRQLDQLRGSSRVWIVGTHLSRIERAATIGYLERIGRRLDTVFEAPARAPVGFAAYARLYDLTDPQRLASASAESYPIPDVRINPLSCRAGPMAPQE